MRRDAEIAAVSEQINGLLNELSDTVEALKAILSGTVQGDI